MTDKIFYQYSFYIVSYIYLFVNQKNERTDNHPISYYFIEPPTPLSAQSVPNPFPLDALPQDIREYAEYTAKTVQVHPDMPAVIMLSVIAACAQGKARISVTSEWSEELSIYTAVVADSGGRKTPVFAKLTAPLKDYVDRYNRAHSVEIEMYRSKLSKLEVRKNALITSNASDAEIEEVQKEITALQAHPKLPLRIVAQDCTPEAVAVIMASNGGKIAILSDEGVFDVMAGQYSNGRPNINIYLNAYDGQAVSIDRKNSGSIFLKRPLITFGICCQPPVIEEFVCDRRFTGRGLTQRFLFCKPPDIDGKRTIYSGEENTAVKEKYRAVINRILDMPDSNDYIKFSPEAFDLFNSFFNENESRICADGRYSLSKTFYDKLLGKTARISGLLHLCCHSKSEPVSAEDMQNAIKIARYFAEQNEYIFNISSDIPVAEYVLDRLLTNARKSGQSCYRVRDIKRFCQKYKAKQIDEALLILEEHNYVMFEGDNKQKPDRQHGNYFINPVVLYDKKV